MFVLTVDQIGSREDVDRVADIVDDGGLRGAPGVVLGPDRTAGDEFQLVLDDPAAAIRTLLELIRAGRWSVGLGVGAVETPLPATAREGRGDAFVLARSAVDGAKRSPLHASVVAGDEVGADDLTALLHLLLDVRARRSAEGWAVADLVDAGLSQAEVADREGVSPQAVSQRARAAGVRLEQAAVPALVRLLAGLDAPRSPAP